MASPRIKRRLISLVVTALACLTVTAAEKPAASPPNRPTQKLPKCCVWRVTNAKAPFYLAGSIHSLSKDDYPLPSPYDLALNDSQRLVFEYDPDKDEEFQKKFAAAGKYPEGQDIRSRINPRTLAWLRENTRFISWDYNESKKRYHAMVTSFDTALQYRPWWIAENFFDIRSFSDASETDGVDAYFERHARTNGKKMGGLETVDEHVAVLGKLSDRDGEILLLDTLVYMDTADKEFYRMRSAWRRGDIDKLWTLDSRLRREAPWIASRLIDIRNVMWIPRIEREIQSGKPTTVLVGALHFAGPNSVITLLQKRGYTIEQL